MLSVKRRQIAEQAGTLTAYHMFVFMLNPTNQGSNFSWVSFPKMVAGPARIAVDMAGLFGKDLPLMWKVAEGAAEATAKWCIKQSGVASKIDISDSPPSCTSEV